MNKIIAIVGMCGSGKSIANEFFVKKGFKSIYFGGVTIDKLKEENLEINEKNELKRQQETIEIIASENIVSEAVMEAMGTVMIKRILLK